MDLEQRSRRANRSILLQISPRLRFVRIINVNKITHIYNKKFEQIYKGKKNIKVNMSDTQLCVETELLLRYIDDQQKPDKRWFFSTIGDVLNKIKLVGFN